MIHYQDYGQGLKTCCNNSYSTVCMLEMNINDADCMDDNFNHETFVLKKNIVAYQRQWTVYWKYNYWRE